jgi:hypothetical protein
VHGRAAADLDGALDDRPDAVARVTAEGGAEVPSLQRMKAILMSRALRERISEKLSLPEKLNLSEAEAVRALVEMSALKDIGQDGVSVTVTIGGFVAPRVAYLGYPLGFDEARRLCADVANAYPAELHEYLREVNLERARESRRFLTAEYETLSGELSESRDRLQSLRARYELLDPQSSPELDELWGVSPELLDPESSPELAELWGVPQSSGVARSSDGFRSPSSNSPGFRFPASSRRLGLRSPGPGTPPVY